jgi:hypothetical protein
MRALQKHHGVAVSTAGGHDPIHLGRSGCAELWAGMLASVLAHRVATAFGDASTGRALLWTAVVAAGSLGLTSDGAALVVAGAHSPARHVFCRRSLLLAAARLGAVAVTLTAAIALFDPFRDAGQVTSRALAGAGSLGAALGALVCAWIALVEARHAHLDEETWDMP